MWEENYKAQYWLLGIIGQALMWSKEYQKYSAITAIRKMELLLLFIYIIIVILYCMEGAQIICSFIDNHEQCKQSVCAAKGTF